MYKTNGTLKPVPGGGRWAISHAGIHLIENTAVMRASDPARALATIGLPVTEELLDEHFPSNEQGKRCPTFTFMRLWHAYGAGINLNWSIHV